MKIISYNVNGIRAAMNKGFIDWLKAADPDVLCLQEVKALEEQVDIAAFQELGYSIHWNAAEKKGYSGVAILSKVAPDHVAVGMDHEVYDYEGRVLRADFGALSVMCVYIPSGSSGGLRQGFKMDFLNDFADYVKTLKKKRKKMVICGDYNICHKAIDIHNPVANKNSSGFLPEEREWLTGFLEMGFIDTFRHFDPSPHKYTWWTYRMAARKRNLGWRIDYLMATEELRASLLSAAILDDAVHSDHCPILLEIV